MKENLDQTQDQEEIVKPEVEHAQDFLDDVEEVLPKAKTKNASIPVDKFDWSAFENEDELYGADKNSIKDKYSDTLSKVAAGEIVEGTVISMNKREVVVNIGYKSEGVIGLSEFRYNPDLKVGDKVEVYVESTEDKKGQLILSHKQARSLRSWDRVN
jgi:small subunit ribosomal protein S1